MLFITLPAFVISLYLYYPSSGILQISLLVFWLLLLLSNGTVTAYSSSKIKLPKPVIVFLIAFGLAVSLLLFYATYAKQDINTSKKVWQSFLGCVCLGIWSSSILWCIFSYIVAPLFVLEKFVVETELLDYYKAYRRKSSGNYLRFKDDANYYRVDALQFQKFRNKVGITFSYTKCRCLFNVCYIKAIRQESQGEGAASRWELSPARKKNRKMLLLSLLFAAISISFFLIVMAISLPSS